MNVIDDDPQASSGATGPEAPVSQVEHAIGLRGRLVVHIVDGDLTIRGVEGETVKVVDRNGRDGIVVRRGPGFLEVGTSEQRPGEWGTSWGGFLAGAFTVRLGRGPRRADFDIEVPRGADVRVDVVSADVRASGLSGQQRYKTVSGDVLVGEATGGRIQAESISGDLTIRARGRPAVQTKTLSGDVELTADELEALDVQTTSGETRVAATLRPGEHRINSVSGDVLVATDSGLTVAGRTISGDIGSSLPHRNEGGRGRRTLVIGDGSAHLAFRSMSGDLNVTAITPAVRPAPGPAPRPTAAGPAPRPTPPAEPGPDPRLAILQALERGDIDVDEAGRRLAALEGRP